MISFLTIPRPFEGLFKTIQLNAIESWLKLGADVTLYGNGLDVALAAWEYRIGHVEARCNDNGTPLVRDALTTTGDGVTIFANTDNIFLPDLLKAVKRIDEILDEYVIIGRRWNANIDHRLTFELGWEANLCNCVRETGKQWGNTAIDYFVYKTNCWTHMPDFAVGCGLYDHWMVREALAQNIPVIDASRAIMMIHQNHPAGAGSNQEDIDHNRRLAGLEHRYSIKHANWVYDSRGLMKKKIKGVRPAQLYGAGK